jgi:hypothetical protein
MIGDVEEIVAAVSHLVVFHVRDNLRMVGVGDDENTAAGLSTLDYLHNAGLLQDAPVLL